DVNTRRLPSRVSRGWLLVNASTTLVAALASSASRAASAPDGLSGVASTTRGAGAAGGGLAASSTGGVAGGVCGGVGDAGLGPPHAATTTSRIWALRMARTIADRVQAESNLCAAHAHTQCDSAQIPGTELVQRLISRHSSRQKTISDLHE